MYLMLCLYIHVRVLIHFIVLMFTIISCYLSVTPSPLHYNSNNSSPFRLRFSPPSVGLKAANDKNASAVPCHREPIAM